MAFVVMAYKQMNEADRANGVSMTLWSCTRKAFASNFGWYSGYPNLRFFMLFPRPSNKPQHNVGIRALLRPSKLSCVSLFIHKLNGYIILPK